MGTIKRSHLSAAEKDGFLSFTRARTGALEKRTVVTTTPGTGLISSGFRWLRMNELTRLLPHQQREGAQPAYNSALFEADVVHINHDTKVPFSTWPIKEAQGNADVKACIGDISN